MPLVLCDLQATGRTKGGDDAATLEATARSAVQQTDGARLGRNVLHDRHHYLSRLRAAVRTAGFGF